LALLALIALLAIITLPQILVRAAITRHGKDRPDLQGTGGELARHLLNRFDLQHVAVEVTDRGDHYDPVARVVRLLPAHHDGRSIAAAAIAAHEVSHAIQDAKGERLLALRQRLAPIAIFTDRLAGVLFIAAPVLGALARTPVALFALIGAGVALLAVRVVMNLITLPVEIDASFGKALPILREGRYVPEEDMPAMKSVLRAAAFTYLASALISLVNLWRWARLLR
jgi:Zn-dependent membrane protease YugP